MVRRYNHFFKKNLSESKYGACFVLTLVFLVKNKRTLIKKYQKTNNILQLNSCLILFCSLINGKKELVQTAVWIKQLFGDCLNTLIRQTNSCLDN